LPGFWVPPWVLTTPGNKIPPLWSLLFKVVPSLYPFGQIKRPKIGKPIKKGNWKKGINKSQKFKNQFTKPGLN